MRINLVTGPAAEPVVLADMHSQLRLATSYTTDDSYINGLISEARYYCERVSHVCFITQTWDIFLDAWDRLPPTNLNAYFGSGGTTGSTIYSDVWRQNQIRLPHSPIQSVAYVMYTDTAGNQQTWNSANYIVSTGTVGRVAPTQNQFFPPVASQIDVVNVRYVAGYGDSASAVPGPAKSAIRLMAAHLYENRVAVTDVQTYLVQAGLDDLLSSLGHGNNLFA